MNLFGGLALPCERAADFNDDQSRDLTDAISLARTLFLGQAPPASPLGACEIDLSDGEPHCPAPPDCP